MIISGSIRNPDQADALSVMLSVGDAEITMRANGAEVGSWPSAAVRIRPIDATSFEFIAEGDRLIFVPEDPTAFDESPLVGGGAAHSGSRKGRRSKKSDGAKPKLGADQAPPKEGRRLRRRAATHEPSKEKPSKPSRRDRKAAAAAARAEAVPVPPRVRPTPTAAPSLARRDSEPPTEPRKRDPGPDEAPSRRFKDRRNRAWLRTLDTARKYDIFGLDRVPVNKGLRGQQHQHTWDHRVAPPSGPGQRICTICGGIRRRAR